MKRVLLFILSSVSMFTSCIAEKKISEGLRIGVISDIHYLSENLMDNGEKANAYIRSTGRHITATPEVLDIVIKQYLESDIQYLFIPGDLTKDGEKESHEELIKKLKPLQDKGIKIYVIPGNHDINIPTAVGFKGNETYKTANINASEFEKYYNTFGYGDAINRDSASLSYVADLGNDFWLIAIDAARYEEHTTSSISSGRIKPETEKWILSSLEDAKKKGKTVVGMMHHGLVEHIMYQDLAFSQYLVDDWRRLADLFADGGMKAIFTGHFHATDITKFSSANNSSIYDIETGALCSYPFAYRFISLDKNGMDIKTQNIEATKSYPTLAQNSKNTLLGIAQNMALHKIKSRDFNFSPDMISALSELAGHIFVEHAKGDEELNENIMASLKNLKDNLSLPIDTESEDIQLDFYPPDNNVKIQFD